jgi:hypothetical protein
MEGKGKWGLREEGTSAVGKRHGSFSLFQLRSGCFLVLFSSSLVNCFFQKPLSPSLSLSS